MPVTLTGGARKAYVTAIKLEELNAKIFEFRRLLQNPGSDPLPLAQELYRIVFPETLRQDLDVIHAKTIMWSVDGALRYIPMAALHDGHEYDGKAKALAYRRLWQDSPRFGGVPVELAAIFGKEKGSAGPAPGTVRLNAAFTKATFLADLNGRKNVIHVATHFDSRPGVAANSRLLLGDGTTWDLAGHRFASRNIPRG